MIIRRANTADIPHLLRLLVQVCNVHQAIRPDIFRRDGVKYTAPQLQDLLAEESCPVFVAVDGDRFLGYCFCQWQQSLGSTVMADRLELYIDDLCVEEAARGQGVATGLFRHVCAWAKAQGCDSITLNVWQGNGPALSFYENMGMKPRKITMELPLEDIQC